MAQQVQLKARPRAETGKGPVKRMRARGIVPAVIYGPRTQPMSIAIELKDLEKALHHATSENLLVDLQLEREGRTENRLALIQEVQHHPVKDSILHVDFQEVSATEKLRTNVPVRAIGEPVGVKTGGGVLEFVMRELRVECLPKDLPDRIEVNVEALEIGQGIHVGDITPPPGVTFLDDKDQSVFIVAAPITEEELAAMTEAAAVTAEPELIGAEKVEGEEVAAEEGEAKPKAEAAAKGEAKAAPAGKAEAKPAAAKPEAKTAPAKAEAKPAAGKPEAKK